MLGFLFYFFKLSKLFQINFKKKHCSYSEQIQKILLLLVCISESNVYAQKSENIANV